MRHLDLNKAWYLALVKFLALHLNCKQCQIGLDDGTELGPLVGSLEGSNVGISKGALLGDQIEEASCRALLVDIFSGALIPCLRNHL